MSAADDFKLFEAVADHASTCDDFAGSAVVRFRLLFVFSNCLNNSTFVATILAELKYPDDAVLMVSCRPTVLTNVDFEVRVWRTNCSEMSF